MGRRGYLVLKENVQLPGSRYE